MAGNVFVGRLPRKVDVRDLEDLFGRYGKIVDISLKADFGFILFEDERDADDAIRSLHNYELHGSRITCEPAKRKSRGYDRDRDRDRDRDYRDRDRDRDYRDRDRGRDYRDRDRDYRDRDYDRYSSRGGRFDRRDDRAGANKCFNCGRMGHWAKQCPDSPAKWRFVSFEFS
eukprot:TRINITY_DN5049_c0_g2_i1.p2 TRINITY_DN5049_c0_g2~~TRINITY_DN5049_c0_g2_i1.p2  ORF type:complete len:171 (+),score=32.20 TRINITY_DN5049_c0_g2_i1:80-592(+)